AMLRTPWSGGAWLDAGDIHQDWYDPYPPERAVSEELGDLIGEGLLTLVRPGDRGHVDVGTREYWDQAMVNRMELRDQLAHSIRRDGHQEARSMLLALDAVETVHRRLLYEDGWVIGQIQDFTRSWCRDLDTWAA